MPSAVGGPSWDSEQNAARYDQFNDRHGTYSALARNLVRFAGLSPGDRVIDLACGTGVLAREVLAAVGGAGAVIAIDSSRRMLEVGESRLPDPRITWLSCRGEEVGQVVDTSVAWVLCNAALWQMPLGPVCAAVRQVLEPGGAFVFNLPDGAAPALFPPAPERAGPTLLDRMRQVAGWAGGRPDPYPSGPAHRIASLDDLRRTLVARRLRLERLEHLSFADSAETTYAWLRIPAVTARWFPGAGYAARMEILDRAYADHDHGATETRRWISVLARAAG